MGLAGRRRVELYFDVRRMVAAYELIYRSLLFPNGNVSRNGSISHQLPKAQVEIAKP
jgi:hypothetical protein